MKTNKILNIVIIAILSNISANAASQNQINKLETISQYEKSVTQETNNKSNIGNFDIDGSDSDISDSERPKLYERFNSPYKFFDLGSGFKGVFIKDQSIIEMMYPNAKYKGCTGVLTTINDFNKRYLKKINNVNKINNKKQNESKKRYYNNNREIKKYLEEAEQCDCIMCNRNKNKKIYNNNDIEKYNKLAQEANGIVCDFNELPLVENNNRLKIQEFKNGLQNIDTKRNKNNIIQKEFNKLGNFIKEINKKVRIVDLKTNGNNMLNKKRFREDDKLQNIKSKLESISSNYNINTNSISNNNKNNITDSNNLQNKNNNKEDLSISFSCLSSSSLRSDSSLEN